MVRLCFIMFYSLCLLGIQQCGGLGCVRFRGRHIDHWWLVQVWIVIHWCFRSRCNRKCPFAFNARHHSLSNCLLGNPRFWSGVFHLNLIQHIAGRWSLSNRFERSVCLSGMEHISFAGLFWVSFHWLHYCGQEHGTALCVVLSSDRYCVIKNKVAGSPDDGGRWLARSLFVEVTLRRFAPLVAVLATTYH